MSTRSGYVYGTAEWLRRWPFRAGELCQDGDRVATSAGGHIESTDGQSWRLVGFGRVLVDATTGKAVAVTETGNAGLAAGRCEIRTRSAELSVARVGDEWELRRSDSLVASIRKHRWRHRWVIDCRASMLPVGLVVFTMEIIELIGRIRKDQRRADNRAVRSWQAQRGVDMEATGFDGVDFDMGTVDDGGNGNGD